MYSVTPAMAFTKVISLLNRIKSIDSSFDNFPVVNQDIARMEQLSISEQMYNYYYSIFNLTASSPVSGDVPPGNITSNIINKTNPDNKALGYFGACSVSIKMKRL